MTSASVLVAFAMIGGVPKKSSAGNVTRVPPPATTLTAPPAAAASISPRISVTDIVRGSIAEVERNSSQRTSACSG